MKKSQLALTYIIMSLVAAPVFATTAPVPVSEPSILALSAAGAIVGLLLWRNKRKR